MIMFRANGNKLVCRVLLVYFALFIVPPVSAMAAVAEQPVSTPASAMLQQDRQQAALLLFDILLWQSLKKTKHTSESLGPFNDSGKRGLESRLYAAATLQVASGPARPEYIYFHEPILNESRSSSIRFLRSGISPPSFSV